MHETMNRSEKISEMLQKAECCLEAMVAKGAFDASTLCQTDMPDLVDMVKDLAEAKEKCWKACYYKTIVEAMNDYDEDDPMGYNNRRYANGEYAPKGRGHISGFVPMWDDMPHLRPDAMYDGDARKNVMGYPGNVKRPHMDEQYFDRTWAEYDQSRRHYHESGSESDRMEMDEKGMKHAKKSLDMILEIWNNADPAMRKKLKTEMSAVVSDMVV